MLKEHNYLNKKSTTPIYKGPIEYFNLQKFSAFLLGKEIGYTSFNIKDDFLYIELISVNAKYRGYGIAYITFMLSIYHAKKIAIYTNGLTKTGRSFMNKLSDRGLLIIKDECNIQITDLGLEKSKEVYEHYLMEQ